MNIKLFLILTNITDHLNWILDYMSIIRYNSCYISSINKSSSNNFN